MGIVEYIRALMEADRNARMTYEEIANKYCLPLYTVHRLLTESRVSARSSLRRSKRYSLTRGWSSEPTVSTTRAQ